MDWVSEGTECFAAAYLDDIVIFSLTDCMCQRGEILQQLQQAGLVVQPKKCSLYLGYMLGCGVIRPQQDKVQAVKDCPHSHRKKELKSFLGLAGWYW